MVKLKIGFVNFTPMQYDVETPYIEPLGGSESALCYLAVALAKRGHEVTLFCRKHGESKKLGVRHLHLNALNSVELDVLVLQNTPEFGKEIRKRINPRTKLILWSQHASDQPAVAGLKDRALQAVFDSIVLISAWQEDQYIRDFMVDPNTIMLIGNAISPAFENMKLEKKRPGSMAYTSTPFRGLSLLGEIFSGVRKHNPNASLQVFSSMKVYQVQGDEYTQLYNHLKELPAVEYVGSLPQSELAKRLTTVEFLAYPNLFPETSCIAVMEAMAAGLCVVTSELGALPETTAGFAQLIPIVGRTKEEFTRDFVQALLQPVNKKTIRAQMKYVNEHYTWSLKAKEWESLLTYLV